MKVKCAFAGVFDRFSRVWPDRTIRHLCFQTRHLMFPTRQLNLWIWAPARTAAASDASVQLDITDGRHTGTVSYVGQES
jgi:hypothetical protein